MGGGAPAVLTADLCARAIIAAARAYGDDPVKACTCARTQQERRTLCAAAGGLHRGAGISLNRLQPILGVARMTVYTARSKRSPAFEAAEAAAKRAVEFAGWQPQAAASVIGGAADDVVVAEPAAPEPESRPAVANLDKLREAVRRQPAIPITTKAEPLARRAAATAPAKAPAPAQPRTAGPISAALAPAKFAPPPGPASERPLVELVLEALADGERRDSMSLASMIDRKEMAVVSALSQLKSERRVIEEPAATGPRRFRYRAVAA